MAGLPEIQASYYGPRIAIKPEFLITNPAELQAKAAVSYEDDGEQEPSAKKRPKEEGEAGPVRVKQGICFQFITVAGCPRGDACNKPHDVEKFMAERDPDLPGVCPAFESTGACGKSFACAWAGSHCVRDEAGKWVNVNAAAAPPPQPQPLSLEAQKALWKKKYNFKAADDMVKATKARAAAFQAQRAHNGTVKPEVAALPAEERAAMGYAGMESYAEVYEALARDAGERERRAKRSLAHWKGKTYLAPLTTVGNLPFRRICKGFGVDITCGEMALGANLLAGERMEWSLTKRHASEDIFGVQIEGGFLDQLSRTAQLITAECAGRIDFVDLNCGCPLDAIVGKGAGAGLLEKPARLYDITWSVSHLLDVPFTVKLRKGMLDSKLVAKAIIPGLVAAGASAVALHGRTRQQRYLKQADWGYIRECRSVLPQEGSPVPLIGNGDVYTWQEAHAHWDEGACDVVMVARGALIKPWIFTEIRERRDWDISATERLDMLKRFTLHALEHWGSDETGVATSRRFLLELLSFSHRYVPVGIIERLPVALMDRPPPCFGRSDLETLFMSPEPADWVKITEMLLGKVPEGFTFVPKHKSAG